ncbi:MAG: AAA family ATPase [Deltaproteobacteria bacterium]|nr:AAA family ATPase [Deltaproteobacteria bacterium]
MRIRRLELTGFKSFPDRTSLVFGEGVSCIVGPNGCGKSNIVDAIRWCMGEQSARSLRAGDMTDVIFGGADGRGPVGFAEVSLVFTAEGGTPFPGEYAAAEELEITRRLFRTGASDYLINRSRARRRDIQDLFLDTGIGNNLYSFIEQGRIGKIIQATPEERRFLVDEAAGITRYRVKRDEALKQLEATATQLDRVADLADELGKRVGVLRRQVRKVMRARSLQTRVKQLEISLSLAQVSALAADRRVLRQRVVQHDARLRALQVDVDRRRGDLLERREELAAAEAAVQSWRERLTEADGAVRTAEAEQRLTERVLGENRARVEREEGALLQAMEEVERGARALAGLEEEGRAAEAHRRAAEEAAGLAQTAAEARRAEAAGAERRRELAQGEVTRAERAVDQELRRREEVERRLAEEEEQGRALVAERERTSGELLALRAAAEEAEAAVAAQRQVGVALQGDAERAREALISAEAGARDARGALQAAEAAARAARERGRVASAALDALLVREEREVAAERRALEARAAKEAEGRRRARGEQLEVARRQADRARREAVGRRDRWLSALDAAQRGALGALESRHRAAREAEEGERARALLSADQADAAALEAAEAHLQRQHAERMAPLREGLDAASAAGREAQAQAAALRQQTRELDKELAGVGGRVEALRRRTEEEARRTTGSEALARHLAGAPRLRDLLGLGPEEEAALAQWSGDRLLLPVVRQAEQVEAAARLGGAGRFMWIPQGQDPAASLTRGQTVVSGAGEAAAVVARAAVGAVSADGRLRIGADGLVTLGEPGGAAARLQELRQLAALEAQQRELAGRLRLARAEAEATGRRVRRAEDEERGLKDQIAAQERWLREALRGELTALRTAQAGARQRLTQEGRDASRRLSEGQSGAVGALRRGQEKARAQAVREGEEALRRLEASLAAQRAEAAASGDRALAAAEATATAALDEARAALEARVTRAREAAQGERAAQREREVPLDAAVEEARAAHDEAAAREVAASEGSRAADRAASAGQVELARREAAQERAAGAVERALAEREQRSGAAREGEARRERLRGAILSLEEARRAAERVLVGARGEAEQVLSAHQAAQAAVLQAVEAAQASLGAVRVAGARVEALRQRVAEREEAQLGALGRVEALERSAEVLEAEREALEARLDALHQQREAAAQERVTAVDRLDQERQRAAALRERLQGLEAQLAERVTAREEAERELAGLQARVEEIKGKIAHTRERMEERYQVSVLGLLDRLDAQGSIPLDGFSAEEFPELEVPPSAVRPRDLDDEERHEAGAAELKTLRGELERLGEVHLGAVEEYEETRVRHVDLVAQQEDLEGSIAQIRAAVAQMNRISRERFRDTFELVDARFRETYPELAGGGVAHLALTDQEDLLTAGVEVFAAPAGKTMKRMSLLSGGEQAMVGIALILALFRVKPAPFCVMDEVDAPLDEANGARFNRMLKAMSSMSQFVLITHNRFTMEHADTLYGVTMPNPGASRLVSVRLGG